MPAPEQRQLATRYQAEQRVVSSTLTRDVIALLVALLSLGDPGGSWIALKVALKALVRERRAKSAGIAALYYLRFRDDAGIGGRFSPAQPHELAEQRLDEALDGAGLHVYRRAVRLGRTPEAARDTAGVTLTGTMTRLALEGGRDVMEQSVLDDDEALGWARIGDGDPCAWCAMLISRGAVFKSGATAGDVRHGGTQYHDHDGCQAVPVFTADNPYDRDAEELYAQWKRVTAGTSGAEARRVWRRYWEGREAETKTP